MRNKLELGLKLAIITLIVGLAAGIVIDMAMPDRASADTLYSRTGFARDSIGPLNKTVGYSRTVMGGSSVWSPTFYVAEPRYYVAGVGSGNSAIGDKTVDFSGILVEPDEHTTIDGVTANYVTIKQIDYGFFLQNSTSGVEWEINVGLIKEVDDTDASVSLFAQITAGGTTYYTNHLVNESIVFPGQGISTQLNGSTSTDVMLVNGLFPTTAFQADVDLLSLTGGGIVTKPAAGDIVFFLDEKGGSAAIRNWYINVHVQFHKRN